MYKLTRSPLFCLRKAFSIRNSLHSFRKCRASTISSPSFLPLKYVIKVHCTRSAPDWMQPWQCLSQKSMVGSGLVISNQRILTNAHLVSDHSFVTVTKHNSTTHFPATVSAVGHECDLALLTVDHPGFWQDISGHLEFDGLPRLQDTVTVLGYPTGGESISVTRGVVSRLEVVPYKHAACDLLAIQIDAAINNGNSGGPALLGDIESFRKDPNNAHKVIGVAFQNMPRGENIGYIIPTPVINHFLGDIERFGNYKGFCRLGINYQSLTDTHAIHQFFGMDKASRPKLLADSNHNNSNPNHHENINNHHPNKHLPELTGVLVTKVHKNTPAFGKLQPYDIVTHIDGHPISNDGMTKFQDGYIGIEHWLAEKYENEKLELQIFRRGEIKKIDIQMKVCDLLVPIHRFDRLASYYVFGGCVFIPLSQPYLHTWGENWYHYAPRELLSAAFKGDVSDPNKISELVVLSSVLPHSINMGCGPRCNTLLERVGNVEIRSLAHLKQVIESRVLNGDDLLDFYFKDGLMMVLPVQQCLQSEMQILKRHRIPSRQSQDLAQFDAPEFDYRMKEITDKLLGINTRMIRPAQTNEMMDIEKEQEAVN